MLSQRMRIISCVGATLVVTMLCFYVGGFYTVFPNLNLRGKVWICLEVLIAYAPLGMILYNIWSVDKQNKIRSTMLFLFIAMLFSFFLATSIAVRFKLYILCFVCLGLSLITCIWLGIIFKKQGVSAFWFFVFGSIAIFAIAYAYAAFILSSLRQIA